MNTEDYVSYPVALALKKAGFNELTNSFYDEASVQQGEFEIVPTYAKFNEVCRTPGCECVSAPTLWQAQKWLREKKRIAINVIAHDTSDRYREGKYHWEEAYLPNFNREGHQWADWFIYGKHPLFDTYEEALSDGLSQMLELITKGE